MAYFHYNFEIKIENNKQIKTKNAKIHFTQRNTKELALTKNYL